MAENGEKTVCGRQNEPGRRRNGGAVGRRRNGNQMGIGGVEICITEENHIEEGSNLVSIRFQSDYPEVWVRRRGGGHNNL